MFEFAGRQPNLEVQMPFIRRILAEHPNVEFHIWNFARTKADTEYVNNIEGDRITIRQDFHDHKHRIGWNKVYQHYGRNPEYADATFVKLDDDIVFIETHRFGAFLDATQTHPDAVISANIVNNGACTPLQPELWDQFQHLNVPLLDAHKPNEAAVNAHNFFFNHRAELLNQPVELIPTKDWLSINLIAYNRTVAAEFGRIVGMVPHPHRIAGRQFPAPWGLGDEAATNMFPRIIMKGFTAAHLTFGPQQATTEQCDQWRSNYRKLGAGYLSQPTKKPAGKLPELSPTIHYQQDTYSEDNGELADWAIRSGWRHGENDPTCGRHNDARV